MTPLALELELLDELATILLLDEDLMLEELLTELTEELVFTLDDEELTELEETGQPVTTP